MALKEYERHYKLPALAPDKVALVTLLWVAGRIYVPMARDIFRDKRSPAGPAARQPAGGGAGAVAPPVPAPAPAPNPPAAPRAVAEVDPWFDPDNLPPEITIQ
jgi:hypothetical protein